MVQALVVIDQGNSEHQVFCDFAKAPPWATSSSSTAAPASSSASTTFAVPCVDTICSCDAGSRPRKALPASGSSAHALHRGWCSRANGPTAPAQDRT